MSGARASYGPERVRQLRLLLWVVVAAAVLLLVAAALVVPGGDVSGVLLVLVLPGVLMLGLAGGSLVGLARSAAASRPLTAATAVVAILTGLLLSRIGPGLMFAVLGVPLLLVAVLPGRDEAPSSRDAG